MARMMPDGSVVMADGTVYGPYDPPAIRHILELLPVSAPSVFRSGGRSLRGERGPQGEQGPAGATGPQGPSGPGGAGPYNFSAASLTGGGLENIESMHSSTGVFPSPERRVPLSRAGTLRRFFVNMVSNSFTTPITVAVALGGVNTALSIVYAAGETGVKSVDVPVAAAAGALLSFHSSTSPGLGIANLTGNVEFE